MRAMSTLDWSQSNNISCLLLQFLQKAKNKTQRKLAIFTSTINLLYA